MQPHSAAAIHPAQHPLVLCLPKALSIGSREEGERQKAKEPHFAEKHAIMSYGEHFPPPSQST